jgi:acyl-CoA dehydrogenase
MDFELSEEHRMLRDMVRTFVDKDLIPLENALGPDREITPDVMKSLQAKTKEMGLWMLDVPEEYGGAGLDLMSRCIIDEQVGRTSLFHWHWYPLFGPALRPVLLHCNEEQKQRFLFPVLRGEIRICFAQTEPDAGSDPASMRTRAVRDGDDYIINGYKRYITAAGESQYAQLMAATDPEKGSKGGITCFILDLKAKGVTVTESWPNITNERLWEIALDNVREPAANIIGEVGQGFELGQKFLTEARIKSHGARSVGAAQRALDMMIDYSQQRVTFGQPLSERQAIQFMIVDSAMEIRMVRNLVYECAWRSDRGEDIRDLSYMVKIQGTEMVTRVADRAIQIHGGMGVSRELPLEHFYREARAVRINEGATEVLRWRLARNLMRKPKRS